MTFLILIMQALPSQDLVSKVFGILASNDRRWRSASDPGIPEAVDAEPAVPGGKAVG